MDSAFSISPLDGRYSAKLKSFGLQDFSEFNLMKRRVEIECKYYCMLMKVLNLELSNNDEKIINDIYKNFSIENYNIIKNYEKVTNHDVKSVEYFLKEFEIFKFPHMIHFGLTSEDINSPAMNLIIKDFWQKYRHMVHELRDNLIKFTSKADARCLSFTHSQPASAKLFSEKINVFIYRINKVMGETTPFSCKFGGSVGTLESHRLIYPEIDWDTTMDKFIETLGLDRQQYTTQIDNYDDFASLCHRVIRINNIIYNLSQDIWLYIFQEYLIQVPIVGEVGSSVMPHKCNPIDFENTLGNLRLSTNLFNTLASSMPISFLERDLSGSTMMRNTGVAFAHSVLAIKGVITGLNKIVLNTDKISRELKRNPQIVGEVVQNFMRSRGISDSYEQIKDLTRGKIVTIDTFVSFINSLSEEEMSIDDKNILVHIVNNYLS